MRARPVSLRIERQMLRAGAGSVAGIDEVGRGALCGPTTVAAVVVGPRTSTAPRGVRDSKDLSARSRQALVPLIGSWALATAVDHASAAEIDEFGIVAALGLAGRRALAALPVVADAVLLDGSHDYLTATSDRCEPPDEGLPPVRTVIKADRQCASVAAASILAKCARDAIMIDLAVDHVDYGWAQNKGYASAQHVAALARLGPTSQHRRTWRLPGVPTGP